MNVADLIISHISQPMPAQIIMECGCKALFRPANFVCGIDEITRPLITRPLNWSDDTDAGDVPMWNVNRRGPIYTWCEFHSANQCEDNVVRKALRELAPGLSRGGSL